MPLPVDERHRHLIGEAAQQLLVSGDVHLMPADLELRADPPYDLAGIVAQVAPGSGIERDAVRELIHTTSLTDETASRAGTAWYAGLVRLPP